LLGAHTVGRMEERFTGFGGRWMEHSELWNNEYFSDLFNLHWWPKFGRASGKPMYKPPNFEEPDNYPTFLNTDVSLLYDIFHFTPVDNDQHQRCVGSQDTDVNQGLVNFCPQHTGARAAFPATVIKYSHDNDAWLFAYKKAWTKLTENGNNNLRIPAQGTYTNFCMKRHPYAATGASDISCGNPHPCHQFGQCQQSTGECTNPDVTIQDHLVQMGRVTGYCDNGLFNPSCGIPNSQDPLNSVTCNQILCCFHKGDCRHGSCNWPYRHEGFNCTEMASVYALDHEVDPNADLIFGVVNGKCDAIGNCKVHLN